MEEGDLPSEKSRHVWLPEQMDAQTVQTLQLASRIGAPPSLNLDCRSNPDGRLRL